MQHVFWLDGPNGIGKDYLMDLMIKRCEANGVNYKKFVLADEVLIGSSVSETRKYTEYHTPEDKAKVIFERHLTFLDRIKKEIDRKTNLILVNRSFLSFIVYNLSEVDTRLSRMMLKEYTSKLKEITKDVPNKIYRLTATADDPFLTTNLLYTRIEERNEGIPIDRRWIYEMCNRYIEAGEKMKEFYPIGTIENKELKPGVSI